MTKVVVDIEENRPFRILSRMLIHCIENYCTRSSLGVSLYCTVNLLIALYMEPALCLCKGNAMDHKNM